MVGVESLPTKRAAALRALTRSEAAQWPFGPRAGKALPEQRDHAVFEPGGSDEGVKAVRGVRFSQYYGRLHSSL